MTKEEYVGHAVNNGDAVNYETIASTRMSTHTKNKYSESLTDAVPSIPVDVTSSPAIQKTFFAKPRHKNKTHKLPGEQD